MNEITDELLTRLRQLEDEFEREIEAGRSKFRYRIHQGQVIFEEGIAAEHRRLKVGIIRFLRGSPVASLIIAPFVYGLIIPFLFLDLSIWLYQKVCFFVWGIAPVRRSDYILFDRQHLGYLNSVQKLNCVFCSYANGLIAYVQEVAARTEQFWCPIKHAVRTKSTHQHYQRFLDYGDAEGFRDRLEELRAGIMKSNDV
jgi:hypothetical protein